MAYGTLEIYNKVMDNYLIIMYNTWKEVSFSIHNDTHDVITTAVDGMISCKKQNPAARENIKQT